MQTLADYRALAVLLFGAESGATKFLDKKIEDQGAGEMVVADESQMLYLLNHLNSGEQPNARTERPE